MNSKLLFLPLATALVLSSCDEKGDPFTPNGGTQETPVLELTQAFADSVWEAHMSTPFSDSEIAIPKDTAEAYYEDYVENWLQNEETRDVEITFNGDKASYRFLDDSKKTPKYVKISVNGAHVTIVNDSVENGELEGRARMNYILKGKSDNASIRVYSNKKYMITLDDATLSSQTGSVISGQVAQEKKRMFLYLEKGTVNTIIDAENYSDTIPGEDDKGAIFSEGKLIITGEGTLNVTGRYGHAIASDDRIHIQHGVNLNVIDAAKDALHAKDDVVISGGLTRAYATKDAVQCEKFRLRGGRLLAAGTRALTTEPEQCICSAGTFCLLSIEECSSPVRPSGAIFSSFETNATKEGAKFYVYWRDRE